MLLQALLCSPVNLVRALPASFARLHWPLLNLTLLLQVSFEQRISSAFAFRLEALNIFGMNFRTNGFQSPFIDAGAEVIGRDAVYTESFAVGTGIQRGVEV